MMHVFGRHGDAYIPPVQLVILDDGDLAIHLIINPSGVSCQCSQSSENLNFPRIM